MLLFWGEMSWASSCLEAPLWLLIDIQGGKRYEVLVESMDGEMLLTIMVCRLETRKGFNLNINYDNF